VTGAENIVVFIWEKVWFEPELFSYNYSKFLKPSHSLYLPAYEDGTGSVPKRLNIEFRRRGITQKKTYNIVQLFCHNIQFVFNFELGVFILRSKSNIGEWVRILEL